MKQTRYVPRIGSRVTAEQAQFIGEIAEKNGGLQSKDAPRALIRASRDPSAPTHKFFARPMKYKAHDWDLHQARMLINRIEFVVSRDEEGEPTKTVRAFIHLRPTEEEVGGYFPTVPSMKSPALRERIFADVERRLKTARALSGQIKELAEIIDAAIQSVGKLRKRSA